MKFILDFLESDYLKEFAIFFNYSDYNRGFLSLKAETQSYIPMRPFFYGLICSN